MIATTSMLLWAFVSTASTVKFCPEAVYEVILSAMHREHPGKVLFLQPSTVAEYGYQAPGGWNTVEELAPSWIRKLTNQGLIADSTAAEDARSIRVQFSPVHWMGADSAEVEAKYLQRAPDGAAVFTTVTRYTLRRTNGTGWRILSADRQQSVFLARDS